MLTEYDQSYGQRGYQPYEQRGYQPYDHHRQQQLPPPPQQRESRQTILERGRAVRLMKNGDPFFTGRLFMINQKRYPMLDVLLDDASKALSANFGPVRCIYTPKHGSRVQDISDFEDHHTYVAAGGERFKKLHYLDIAEGKRVSTKGQTSPKLQLPPVRRMDVEGRALKLSRSENIIIYVFRNGDPLTLPMKILLVKANLQKWESVLDEVTKKVILNNTAVLKLYAMNGELITSGQQLEYNGMYVAAGKERFKRLDYPDPKSLSANSSPKTSRKSSNQQPANVNPRIKLPPRQSRTEVYQNQPTTHPPVALNGQNRYTKSDGTNTYTMTSTVSYGSAENAAARRPVREENDFFHQKPQQPPAQHRRGPTKETDLDRDDGGIYKRRVNHRDYAEEIDDNRETKVDLPVDYREVETVDDENLYSNIGRTPRRHPPAAADPRLHAPKSPMNFSHEEENGYPYAKSRVNGFDSDYHRQTPPQREDNRKREPSPYSSHRPAFISPSPQSNKKEANQAATVIQSNVRDYLTRKQTHPDHDERQQMHAEHPLTDHHHHQPSSSPIITKRRNFNDDYA